MLNDTPFSEEVKRPLHWAHDNDRYVISLCHGLGEACWRRGIGETKRISSIVVMKCVFPDSLDTGANIDIGCHPRPMPWLVGERLRERA